MADDYADGQDCPVCGHWVYGDECTEDGCGWRKPITWATSGLDAISIQAMRNVAVLFPDGPVAETVRILDSRECTCGTTGSAFVPLGHYRDCPQFEKSKEG